MAVDLSANYFDLFGLPVAFAVDADALNGRYRELQQAVHPDRFANASEQERRVSMQQATRLNEAYQTLRDPLSRARYLLELNGVRWDDEQDTMMDPGFLMEQMDKREALESVRDQADPLEAIGQILDSVSGDIRQVTGELAGQFENADSTSLEAAKDGVRKLQFLYKLRSEAEGLEADLEDEL